MSDNTRKKGAARATAAKPKPRGETPSKAGRGSGGKAAPSATPKGRGTAPTAKSEKKAAPASAEAKKRTGAASAEAKKRTGAASAEGKASRPKNAASPKKPAVRPAKATSAGAGKTASKSKKTNKATTSSGAKGKNGGKGASGRSGAKRVQANPVAAEANRRNAAPSARGGSDDLFLERGAGSRASAPGGTPPGKRTAVFGALNACLAIAIAVLIALGVRVQSQYAKFLAMREVVDQQTFYEGTTVEGVDVSKMTLSNALDHWRERVEARYAGRRVTLSDGTTVTAGELGYTSDYESVLSAAWSAGRSGTLEERYRMASGRIRNPAAFTVTRVDYNDTLLNQFVQMQALKIDQPAVEAAVEDFDVDTYEFTFSKSRAGKQLDTAALKRDLIRALDDGGGNVALVIAELPPQNTTEEMAQMYGMIDYAVTNASSSSRARLNNIKLAMSMINGTRLEPGETFSFNETVGQRTAERGFQMATAYSGGEVTEQVGGGICQVSTTLFNAAVKADMKIVERYNHSLTVAYVDKGKDATVDWGHQDLKFTNTSPDAVYICCYLTEDKRVRFGIFGRLLPNGEKITLDGVTTQVIKFATEYEPDPSLPAGETRVSQNGRDGYRAEAYKVRWDAEGNELSRELLCSSVYKSKNEIVLYGA